MDVNKIISGALAGLVSAVAVDLDAFKKWLSVKEFQTFNWKLAALRWLKGAVARSVPELLGPPIRRAGFTGGGVSVRRC